jgi:AcrR family transcriptional regulator
MTDTVEIAEVSESKAATGRPGVYSRGSDTVDAILKAALHVLIEEGAAAFSLRRIAAQCGLKVGNVSYHFPRKELLVQLLLEEMLISYESLLDDTARKPGLTAEQRLALVVTLCLDDIRTKRTTHLFTELWALANHNEFVAERVAVFYRYVHDIIATFVAQLNPTLEQKDVEAVALFISSTMEGTTTFCGFGKPWEAMMPQIKAITIKAMIDLAKSVRPEDIHGLSAPQNQAG